GRVADGRVPGEELGEGDEVALADRRRRRGHVAPVELVEAGALAAAGLEAQPEPVSGAPRRRAQQKRVRLGSDVAPDEIPVRLETAGREHGRRPSRNLYERLAEPHASARRLEDGPRQPFRLEPATGGRRIACAALGHHGPERLEPVEIAVEPVEHGVLEHRIAVGAFRPEAIKVAVTPDDAARQEHRAAAAASLLIDLNRRAPGAGLRCRGEPGHPGAGDDQIRQTSENVGLCSTYSILIRFGPQTNTANVLAASRTSATSIPRRRASSSCSCPESTSSAMWFRSGRSPSEARACTSV